MYKLLKSFAPVILVLYLSTFLVGTCWGEEGKITAKILLPEKLHPGQPFEIKAKFLIENGSGESTPIANTAIVSIEVPEGFEVKNSFPKQNQDGERIYRIISSWNYGIYNINFNINKANKSDTTKTFKYSIEVYPKMLFFGYAGAIYGISSNLEHYSGDYKILGIKVNDMSILSGIFILPFQMALWAIPGYISGKLLDCAIEQNYGLAELFYPLNSPFYTISYINGEFSETIRNQND
jgi:hypothetical protein